jgi:hypothetical protein
MNSEENASETLGEEVDPDWVNHWQEKNDKKEAITKQLTF